MTDIMQSWKEQRFIIAPAYLADGLQESPDAHLIVLTDISYWYNHYEELVHWCEEHNCKKEGMTVDIPDHESLTLFCLKWA